MKVSQGIALAVTFVLFLAGSALYTVSEVSQVVVTGSALRLERRMLSPG